MSKLPSDLRYAKTHEWSRLEEGGRVRVGITDHAQDQLGDVVYIEMPALGRQVEAGESIAVIESVKAASDIYSPVSGIVAEVNGGLGESPEKVNQDAYAHWLFAIDASNVGQLDSLLDADGYRASIGE